MKHRIQLKPDKRQIIWIVFSVLVIALIVFRIISLSIEEKEAKIPPPMITFINPSGQTEEIALENLIIGIVAAETPAAFDSEALKAQAVAARTYVLSHWPPYGTMKHENAAVCSDFTCCQAYLDQNMQRERWGTDFDTYYTKIKQAVFATSGEILFWQGAIAQAPFFSTCGGKTENSEECWSKAFPYLVSVECHYCGHSSRYSGYQRYTTNEAASLLNIDVEQLLAMKIEAYTNGDRVAAISFGSKQLKGTEMRSIFKLDSAAFSWLIIGDYLVFSTVGYGHGVGMCQYGADGMGKRGYSYQEILSHYYPGTTITKMDGSHN